MEGVLYCSVNLPCHLSFKYLARKTTWLVQTYKMIEYGFQTTRDNAENKGMVEQLNSAGVLMAMEREKFVSSTPS
jgi:hypothetical protein